MVLGYIQQRLGEFTALGSVLGITLCGTLGTIWDAEDWSLKLARAPWYVDLNSVFSIEKNRGEAIHTVKEKFLMRSVHVNVFFFKAIFTKISVYLFWKQTSAKVIFWGGKFFSTLVIHRNSTNILNSILLVTCLF